MATIALITFNILVDIYCIYAFVKMMREEDVK